MLRTINIVVYIIFFFLIYSQSYAQLNLHSYLCKDWLEFSIEEKNQIKSSSLEFLDLLKQNKYMKLWELCHPLLKDNIPKSTFIKSIEILTNRINQNNEYSFLDSKLVIFRESSKLPQLVVCGSVNTEDTKHLRFIAVPGVKNMVLVFYRTLNYPIEHIVTLKLGIHANQYKLLEISVNPTKFKNKDSYKYERVAIRWHSEGKLLQSYLAYLMAARLSQLGRGIQNEDSTRIQKQIQLLRKSRDLHQKIVKWFIKNTEYRIINIDLIETLNDISPWILYVSHKELGDKTTPHEAKELFDYLLNFYPEIGEEFEAILFQAYNEYPSDSTKQYSIYRVPIKIDPNK